MRAASLKSSSSSISEAAGFINVSVTLSGATGPGMTVDYTTQANAAHPGTDYGTPGVFGIPGEVSGTLTFGASDVQKIIIQRALG